MVKSLPAHPGDAGDAVLCGARGGFLPRHDEDLREPLMRRQGSQVSMRVARGSASWLSSHGRGLGPRDALKKDSRGLSRGAALFHFHQEAFEFLFTFCHKGGVI